MEIQYKIWKVIFLKSILLLKYYGMDFQLSENKVNIE